MSVQSGVADAVVSADPDNYTTNMSKAARPGKIFLDYARPGGFDLAPLPKSLQLQSEEQTVERLSEINVHVAV